MSRKLIHSIRALTVAFGLFAAAVGVGITTGADRAPAIAALHGELAGTAPLPQVSEAAPLTTKHRKRRREARDEMAMPFFSFAHVVRRNNGG